MSADKQTAQIIRSVKEILQKSLDNPNELSKLIDSYLIPLATEKKKNAEVSTPYQLRQDMLNKMPADIIGTSKSPTLEIPNMNPNTALCRFRDNFRNTAAFHTK